MPVLPPRPTPQLLQAALVEAFGLHQRGQLAEAAARYEAILAVAPKLFDALHLRGVVGLQQGDAALAAKLIGQAVKVDPRNPVAQGNLGTAQARLGRFTEAVASFDRAIALAPNQPDAHANRANALAELGRPAAALDGYGRALALRPDHAEAQAGRAGALRALGRLPEALAAAEAALALRPDLAEAHNARGTALTDLGRAADALVALDRAIALNPGMAKAHVNRASLLCTMRRFSEALASAGQAVALAPDDATAELARGTALLGLQRPGEAAEAFRRAVALRPGFADAQDNLALALVTLGQSDAAEDASARALRSALAGERDGRLAEDICAALRAIDRLPAIYADAAQLQGARDSVAAALAIAEDRLGRLGRRSPAAAAALRRTVFRASGFYIAYQQQDDREVMRRLSHVISGMLDLPAQAAAERVRRPGPIRLGIASELLYRHNAAWWALDWLAQLPQRDYAFFTYAFHEVRDPVADGFAQLGTHRSLPFREESADRALATMRADDLDILMLPDIGMTPSSRVLSLHRVAPVQLTAWGHPVTSGSPCIDYYLSSDLMEPQGAEAHYTEQLVRLPNLGLFLRPAPPVAGEASFGLPEGRILLGCLQSLYKYLPAHDAVLPAIARQVPQALFVFLEGQPAHMTTVLRARLSAAFAAAGLDADRHVVFLPRQSYEGYRLLAGQMDACLDSIGWSGGNSTLEAIEAGVPVVTLPGAFMRGRHSAAILGMMGMQDLIAADAEDYVAKVVALARDPALRAERRQEIQARKARLYEDRAFIAALDAFLKSRVAA